MSDVLIVGAGPVGLTLAAELSRHGATCRLIDKAPAPSPFCRAIGVTPRTLEIWEDMGIVREMADAGLWLAGLRSVLIGQPPQDVPHTDLGLPYAPLGLPQYETERLLARHLSRHGLAVERGVALEGLEIGKAGTAVRLRRANGEIEEAQYRFVVGCDGAHSAVRKAAGIRFEGEAYPWPFMLGDVHVDWNLPYGVPLRALRPVEGGPPDMFIAIPLPEPGRYRVTTLAKSEAMPAGSQAHGIQTEQTGPSLEELQAVADDLLPDTPRLSDLRWSSIFRISVRLADRYRNGPVFIAGDAAHIHPPTGGQGMNTGIQDAYNLAWKLALVLAGKASTNLLDSYDAERRPVGEEVLARTHAASQTLARPQGRQNAAPERLVDAQVLVNYRGSAWVRDDLEPDAPGPRAGDRVPDVQGLRRQGFGFPLRLFELLKGTDHVLLVPVRDEAEAAAVAAFARGPGRDDGVPLRVVAIAPDPLPQQSGLTLVTDAQGAYASACGAAAMLVRPDGHVAWRGRSWREPGLAKQLERYRS
ncbi:Flavin-dependent monooxygenase [Labrys miyagiensis]